MRIVLRRFVALCLTLFAVLVHGHGGVSMDEDTCVMQIGPYKAHFTGYQPMVRASQEFCEDIPAVANAIIALDFLDAPLRDMDVDFRVVRDVNRIGVTATYDDLGGDAAIEQATVFYERPQRYPRGNVNVTLEFDTPGQFIGVVTAENAGAGERFTSVFPFSVGVTAWYRGWQWLVVVLVFGAVLYFQPWGKAAGESPKPSSS